MHRNKGTVQHISLTCSSHSAQFTLNVPNGTRVWNKDHPTIHYIWHNGKVVPAYDKAGLKKIDKVIDGLRTQGAAYFTTPIAVSAPPADQTTGDTARATASRPPGDPVAATTSLWAWGAPAILSAIAAAACVLWTRKSKPRE